LTSGQRAYPFRTGNPIGEAETAAERSEAIWQHELPAGNHIKFDDKGRRVDAPLVIFQWQQGVPVTVYPQGPGTAQPRWALK
jgi:hypothetical protein